MPAGFSIEKGCSNSEKPFLPRSENIFVQCFLLKSRNEPFGAGGGIFFGVVASQIILDKLRSIGDMVIASRNIARKARAKIMSMPADTRIASRITGISGPTIKSNGEYEASIHEDYKIESDHYTADGIGEILKKVVHFILNLGYC